MADLSVTAANVQPAEDAVFKVVTIGATVTAGQWVYEDSVTGKVLLAIAAAAGTAAQARATGVMMCGGADGQKGVIQTEGDYTAGGTVVSGIEYRVSTSGGAIAPSTDAATSNAYRTTVGVGISTTKIRIKKVYGGLAA